MSQLMDDIEAAGDATHEQVLAALEEHCDEWRTHGGQHLDISYFYMEGDVARYHSASAWWPTDAPPMCAIPSLAGMLKMITVTNGPPGRDPLTFQDVLLLLWHRCINWLVEEGRSTEHPNESAEQRRKRQNREAVARHRALTREVAEGDPKAVRLRSLHAAYIEACKARKAAVQAAHDAHTPACAEAFDAWNAAKAELSPPPQAADPA
jgi:hypothetical protein